ncbi:MAG: type II toxin-antitoxin system RelE family toxin [Bacillota bacterium]
MYRLRIESYRVIFAVDHQEQTVYIEAIGNRGDIY